MVYPIVVIIDRDLILTFIMWFIIPKFEEIFADFGVEAARCSRVADQHQPLGRRQQPGPQQMPGAVFVIAASRSSFFIFWKLIRKAGPGRAGRPTP
jgi:hypothetical protein